MPLRSVLIRLGWSDSEVKVFTALLENGPMQGKDLALKADVPKPHVYGVLAQLKTRGAIKETGKRPLIFAAQNPRVVINSGVDQVKADADEILLAAETAWETAMEKKMPNLDIAWTLHGLSGFVTEFTRISEGAKKSIYIVDRDLQWLGRRHKETLIRLKKSGEVKILSSHDYESALSQLHEEKVEIKVSNALKCAFCIVDDRSLLIRLGSSDIAVYFQDEFVADALKASFSRMFEDAEKLPVNEIVS
ncbi:MAG: hypothetical protein OK439_00335 [Thaumarchaeota archaeon]|nr:hypothetical protein [Nitrososphaerota archaeon]